MMVLKDFFLKIPDLDRVCMGWDEVGGSMGARDDGSVRGRAGGAAETERGAAGAEEEEGNGLGICEGIGPKSEGGEWGVFGLGMSEGSGPNMEGN